MPGYKMKKYTKAAKAKFNAQAKYRAQLRAARLKVARLERAKQKTRDWRSKHMFLGKRKY